MTTPAFKTLCQRGTIVDELWVLCPFAGGSHSAFNSWASLKENDLPNNTQVLLATYPGRDQRMKERALSSIGAIACDVFDALMARMASTPQSQTPRLRICGHSMGAQVAFEVCKHFEDHYGSSTPVSQLVLSGCHAPHLESRRKLSHLNDQDFVEQLIEIGSGSPVLKQHPELLTLFLPMLRADFSATENYLTTQGDAPKLAYTPCTLLFGEQDPEAWSSEVTAWKDWHTYPEMTSVSGLPGDHFYITAQPTQFIQSVITHAHDAPYTSHYEFGEHHYG
ncbi:thioesterase II family protein [Vibrio coralliilyticus]|uniref:thioesterase II family protein n=1 Tax=Vibrio coralliilyticus TaxID=190893 RepID=UPI00155FC65B|nr:thioesterase [Vibrio coralliilyticus]NRF29932.1 thioesterase [Vibrio coralliilyticus]NRF51260.1 thioesterase [Vibrio coralliilyticus]NRG03797.1 thioesterase [Vibrio coralliilyticus]